MSYFKSVLDEIQKNKFTKETGGYVGIPVPFDRLRDYIPVIDRGQSIGILAGSGVGKSRFSRYLFIHYIYDFYKKTGYNVNILFFPLEDSKSKVYKHLISNYLYVKHGVVITHKELDSKVGKHSLPDFVLEYITEAEDYFKEFEKVVTIVDGLYTPKNIYKFCENHAFKVGETETYYIEKDGEKIKQYRYNSDVHTIVVIDNMSNLDRDDECPSEREAMIKMSKDYGREKLCNFFNFTVVQILQQDYQTERQQFSASGQTIVSKLEPSLASVGDAKVITRNMHLVMSLFDPSRFDLIRYPIPPKNDPENCYDIDVLGNKFRSLRVIKNNDGETGIRVPLLMNPIPEVFSELPLPKTKELKDIYQSIKRNYSKPLPEETPMIFPDDMGDDMPF